MIDKNFFNLPRYKIFSIGSILLGIIPAGLLFLYIFKSVLFEKGDFLVLVFLSIAITMPSLVVNYFTLSSFFDNNKPSLKDEKAIIIYDANMVGIAAMTTMSLFSIINLAGYFFSLILKDAIIFFLIFQTILVIIVLLVRKKERI